MALFTSNALLEIELLPVGFELFPSNALLERELLLVGFELFPSNELTNNPWEGGSFELLRFKGDVSKAFSSSNIKLADSGCGVGIDCTIEVGTLGTACDWEGSWKELIILGTLRGVEGNGEEVGILGTVCDWDGNGKELLAGLGSIYFVIGLFVVGILVKLDILGTNEGELN